MKIYIIADSFKDYDAIIWEYQKRLRKQLEIIKLKVVKHGSPHEIIAKETRLLKSKLDSEKLYKIVLSPQWKKLSTLELDSLIEKQRNSGKDVAFAIGWANGLDYSELSWSIDMELSLSDMTLPHSLVLTILVEQIYRCSEIQKGSSYNK